MQTTMKVPVPAPPPIPAPVHLAERAADTLALARRVLPSDWQAMSSDDRLSAWLEPIACALTSLALTNLHPPRRQPAPVHPGVRTPAPRSPQLVAGFAQVDEILRTRGVTLPDDLRHSLAHTAARLANTTIALHDRENYFLTLDDLLEDSDFESEADDA